MYIQPNTTIKFLQNIPFDADYNDTVYFSVADGVEGQYEYFNQRTKYTINENYYQRVNKGELKVQLPYSTGVQYESTAEKLYDCNYMMFRNTNFGNKWFYAFINSVEWVNNETAKITYEIDEMQTWFFDYELEQCFIEREHSRTDEVGDNLVPENLDMGYEMVETNRESFVIKFVKVPTTEADLRNGWCIIVLTSKIPSRIHSYGGDWHISPSHGGIYDPYGMIIGGLYGFTFNACTVPRQGEPGTSLRLTDYFHDGDSEDLQGFLNAFLNDTTNTLVPDDIITMYMCPQICVENDERVYTYLSQNIAKPEFLGGNSLSNSYTPKNNKLLTYPYVQLIATNYQGAMQSYKFEYFDPNTPPTFRITGVPIFSPTLCCYPVNYNPVGLKYTGSAPTTNLEHTKIEAMDYGLSISNFTQCSWVGDTFKAWWAQNKNSVTTSSVMGVISGILQTGLGVTALVGGGASGVGAIMGGSMIGTGLASVGKTVAGTVAKVNDVKNLPPTPGGTNTNSALNELGDLTGFGFITKTLTVEQAKIIDDYFTMFGYATHRVKAPNRHVRRCFTYTQTVGCTIRARCPGDSQKKICQIYDKGIRFWDKQVVVGEYINVDNSPILTPPNI